MTKPPTDAAPDCKACGGRGYVVMEGGYASGCYLCGDTPARKAKPAAAPDYMRKAHRADCSYMPDCTCPSAAPDALTVERFIIAVDEATGTAYLHPRESGNVVRYADVAAALALVSEYRMAMESERRMRERLERENAELRQSVDQLVEDVRHLNGCDVRAGRRAPARQKRS